VVSVASQAILLIGCLLFRIQVLQDTVKSLSLGRRGTLGEQARCPTTSENLPTGGGDHEESARDFTSYLCAGLATAGLVFGACYHYNSCQSEYRRILEEIGAVDEIPPFGEWLTYRLDRWFSSTSAPKPRLLGILTLLILAVGTVVFFFIETETSFGEALWSVWTFVADAGSHAETKGLVVRLTSLLITLGGMFIFALMVGLVTDGISEYVDDLKKGKSRVLERGHTLILGWSDKVPPLINELALANESEGRGMVVVLSRVDKEEMEEIVEDSCDLRACEHNHNALL